MIDSWGHETLIYPSVLKRLSPTGDLACDINRAPTKGWSFLHLCFWFPQCVPSSSFTYEYAFVQCSCESRFTVRTFDRVAVVQSKIKIALYRARQVRMYKGPFIRTSAKFLGFWTPSPLVRNQGWSTVVNSRNLPYCIRILVKFFDPPLPLSANVINGSPLFGTS